MIKKLVLLTVFICLLSFVAIAESSADLRLWGTEYTVGDHGTTFLQLLNINDTPINYATCQVSIHYPDKTIWKDWVGMSFQLDSDGIYYYDFILPNQTGVYMMYARCTYDTETNRSNVDYMELSHGTIVSGDNSSLNVSDDIHLVVQEVPPPFVGGGNISDSFECDALDCNSDEWLGAWDVCDSDAKVNNEPYEGSYSLETRYGTCAERNFNVSATSCVNSNLTFWLRAEVFDEEGAFCSVEYFNGTGYTLITNQTVGDDTYHEYTLEFCDYGWSENSSIRFKQGLDNNNKKCWLDYINITYEDEGGSESNNTQSFSYNITFPMSIPEEPEQLGISIEYQWTDNTEDVYVYIYNYSAGSFVQLPNALEYAASDTIVINYMYADEANCSDFIQNGDIIIKLEDETPNDGTTSTLSVDDIHLDCVYGVSDSVDVLRGSGELHVTDRLITLLEYLQDIYNFLTVTIWEKLLNIEATTNETLANTEEILARLDNLTVDLDVNFTVDANVSIDVNFSDVLAKLDNLSVNVNVNSTIAIQINETLSKLQLLQEIVQDDFGMSVYGTDYSPGDNARVFLQLTQNRTGFNDAFCQLNIHYPDSVDIAPHYLVENNFMKNMMMEGLYYYDFTIPNEIGIYISDAVCYTGVNTTIIEPYADVLHEGSVQSGSLNDTIIDDGTYYYIDEQINPGSNRSYVHDFYFDVSSFPNVTNFTLVETAVGVNGRLNPAVTPEDESITFYLYNWTGAFFVPMDNIWYSQDGVVDTGLTNTPPGLGGGHYKNGSDIVLLRLHDNVQTSDVTSHKIRLDRLFVGTTTQVPETVTIQGGVELNVRASIPGAIGELNETIIDEIATELDFTSHGEYFTTDTSGKEVVRFFRGSQPINNDQVEIKMYYPNMSVFVDWTNMTFLDIGIYYHDFTIDNSVAGVFMTSARAMSNEITYYASHTFHVQDEGLNAVIVK